MSFTDKLQSSIGLTEISMAPEQTKFIVIEPCDFVSHPAGGQLNFARLLLSIFRAERAESWIQRLMFL